MKNHSDSGPCDLSNAQMWDALPAHRRRMILENGLGSAGLECDWRDLPSAIQARITNASDYGRSGKSGVTVLLDYADLDADPGQPDYYGDE